MGINQFRAYALKSVCDGLSLKTGECEGFRLEGWDYMIIKTKNGFTLVTKTKSREFNEFFKTLPELFKYIFWSRCISYN